MSETTRYTTKEAAELLGLHELTIIRWVKAGRLPDRRHPGARKHWFFLTDLIPNPSPKEQPAK